jgi:hypothetical protein
LRPEQKPIFKIAMLVVGLLLVGGLAGGGYYAYTILTTVAPPPELVPRPVQVAPVPTAEELAAEAETAAEADAAAAAEAAAAMAAAQAEAKAAIAKGNAPVVPVVVDPVIPDPSPEFLNWVREAKIISVRQGTDPRATINGLSVKKGETIDFPLGIVFEDVDAERNLVIFKESSGAVVAKKF